MRVDGVSGLPPIACGPASQARPAKVQVTRSVDTLKLRADFRTPDGSPLTGAQVQSFAQRVQHVLDALHGEAAAAGSAPPRLSADRFEHAAAPSGRDEALSEGFDAFEPRPPRAHFGQHTAPALDRGLLAGPQAAASRPASRLGQAWAALCETGSMAGRIGWRGATAATRTVMKHPGKVATAAYFVGEGYKILTGGRNPVHDAMKAAKEAGFRVDGHLAERLVGGVVAGMHDPGQTMRRLHQIAAGQTGVAGTARRLAGALHGAGATTIRQARYWTTQAVRHPQVALGSFLLAGDGVRRATGRTTNPALTVLGGLWSALSPMFDGGLPGRPSPHRRRHR